MDFVSNQDLQIQEMLKVIGVSSIEELFQDIPSSLLKPRPNVEDGLSEYEGLKLMEGLAAKNTFALRENYLGAGAYEHHVPALVGAVCQKSEFLTSYTPYQAEASQGMLQAIFEYQSAICALTGLDAANASLYDGASACAEAMLMALRLKKGCNKVIVARSLHPHYRSVVRQYLVSHQTKIEEIGFDENGQLSLKQLSDALDEQTAAVLIGYPNFFGTIEEMQAISELTKKANALFVLCANPLVYGLYKSAREWNADIAVGDVQPFGLSLQFGGPYVGYMACKEEFIRQLPGRLAGETVDAKGNRGFVLTLQAREQHIRREKATSNICTNQALAALAALVAMGWYGKEGLHQLALTNFQRASYLRENLSKIPTVAGWKGKAFLNEFVVRIPGSLDHFIQEMRKQNIEPGLPLKRFFPELDQHLLIAVTETKSKAQLDRYLQSARNLISKS